MNDHVHAVVLKSPYRIEQVVAWMKGAATHALGLDKTPWTRGFGKVFIDDGETLRAAVRYVEDNPRKAGMAAQSWEFVQELPVKYRQR